MLTSTLYGRNHTFTRADFTYSRWQNMREKDGLNLLSTLRFLLVSDLRW